MKKLIITLALVALASAAWAQRQPQEITLPPYLPPSYHSPHGGTGYADSIKADPRPPTEWPSGSQGYVGDSSTYVVPYYRPPASAPPEDHVKAVEDFYRRREQLHKQNLMRLGDPRLR